MNIQEVIAAAVQALGVSRNECEPSMVENYGQIYSLHDPISGELRYIGQTTTPLATRLKRHRANRGTTHIANWLRTLAGDPLITHLCLASSQEELDLRERQLIKKAREIGFYLTNLDPGGRGRPKGVHRGWTDSAETRRKKSEAMKGNKYGLGKTQGPEARRKKSEAMKGNKHTFGHRHSEETRKKMREHRKGQKCKPLSEEARQKISLALKGRTFSAERRESMSKGQRGRPVSEETRAKISQANRGRKHSEETIRKMEEAHARRRLRKLES